MPMNNPNHFRHYPRQPNVQVLITDGQGKLLPFLHIITELDMFVLHGVTLVEVREYPNPQAPEPGNVTLLINPAKVMLLAKEDPPQYRPQE